METLLDPTKEERNFMKEYGNLMLESESEEIRTKAYKLFIDEYEFLKEMRKNVSEFDLYLKLYNGKI